MIGAGVSWDNCDGWDEERDGSRLEPVEKPPRPKNRL